ncbi:exopolysaccharide biosynthesis polyprenyl glycosylphosphotransferase [Nocardioides sp. Kera G14]|uniref:exopolysaccharide biosynthesis polyprenyl glycosylphosphotransferase n=1 Tax=Nocardioides sp. Kera G14 TaxID=2884264 RepID=UPI001D119CBB|nr:exopolysaccharide biosynthesis polyprenyl glycosylphosphotransferase [Nocardioides sp. Kera G14]UDY24917.1 exopolysaccharide biosynthesis polyprenyl glycosylphosphotransferase [Nocardioides sp. Kera G14]
MTEPVGGVRARWKVTLARSVVVTDLVMLMTATVIAWLLRFGPHGQDALNGAGNHGHLLVSFVLAFGWWLLLGAYSTRDPDAGLTIGAEFGRLIRGSFAAFGGLGVISVLFVLNVSRSYLLLAFLLGFALVFLGRCWWRLRVQQLRGRGEHQSLVLIVGTLRSSRRIARWFYSDPNCAYRVTGVHVVDDVADHESLLWRTPEDRWDPIPVLGATHTLADALERSGADTVIVNDSEQLGPDGLNELAWQLEGRNVALMVSPNVVGVAQPRLHLLDVSGVPFVLVEKPQYAGANRLAKAVFDRVVASLLLLLVAPAMVTAALAIRLGGRGPILARETRIGQGGRPFAMYRFRTLPVGVVPDEPEALASARIVAGDDVGAPKPTRVGAVLRRYAIDEMPQLFNVLRGDLSIVGPRPLLPRHVEEHGEEVARRLLVKQGITGLWQISGSSTMTWEEATRLDLEYIENWSMLRDLSILWRTFTTLIARGLLVRRVARLQAEIEELAPTSKARLSVDSRGQVFLNAYPLFGGDTTTLLAEIDNLLVRREPALVVTVNVDQILDLEREQKTLEVYDNADLLVMDGMPVVQLARMLGAGEVHRHTGADLLPLMAAESAERGWRVSVLGGADGVSRAAAEQLSTTYPGAQVRSVEFPLLSSVDDPASVAVIEELRAQQPDVVFVCLGAPKQELWVLAWRHELPPAVYVGAGAAVDFAAKTVSRAPRWVQRAGGEWLWRLFQEPRRLFGRYLVKGPRYVRVIARSMRMRRRG